MDDTVIQRILKNPQYQELKAKRSRFGWWLTLAMMVVYYGFILLVAFNKEFLSQKLGDGVMTMGIPVGFGVILFTIVITAIPEPSTWALFGGASAFGFALVLRRTRR